MENDVIDIISVILVNKETYKDNIQDLNFETDLKLDNLGLKIHKAHL